MASGLWAVSLLIGCGSQSAADLDAGAGAIDAAALSDASPPPDAVRLDAVDAFGAEVMYAATVWTSLRIAGVRVGLALQPDLTPTSVGLYFAVGDLDAARADVERAGGKIGAPVEVAPGVFVAEVTDTEGNTLSLRRN